MLNERMDKWVHLKPKGSFKCNHCHPFTNLTKTLVAIAPQKDFSIDHFITCKTTFMSYKIDSPTCKVLYIGRTKRCLHDRLVKKNMPFTGEM